MRSGEGIRPDWKDVEAYAPLLGADRALLAWEWLRRDRDYRNAARQHLRNGKAACPGKGPEQWGLHAFESPDVAVPGARPVWRADAHPYVLPVRAGRGSESDTIDLKSLGPMCRLVTSSGARQHLLICDGLHSIRIDVVEGRLGRGRATFGYLLAGLESAEKPLLTLRRLLALLRTGHFSSSLHPAEPRARRFVLMLRAADAIVSGAAQRDIAAELLDPDARLDRWRVRSPSLRSRVQRLVGSARQMAAGGYWGLLRS